MAWPARLKLRAKTATQATWLVPPAHGWVRTTGRWFWRPLLPALALLCASIALLILQAALWPQGAPNTRWWLVHASLWAMLVGAVLWILLGIKRRLHEPLAFLRAWASRMRRGDLSVRLPVPDRTEFGHLARDINKLSDELQLLTEDMDRQVRNQTARLAQKNQSLEILYDVAASLSTARDLDQLLSRFLQTLMKVVNARAAAVRLLTPNGRMRLVASIGLDKDLVDREQFMPADCSTCGSALAAGTLRHQQDLGCCSHEIDHPFFHKRDMEMIVVPLQYRDRALGVYNLFTDTPNLVAREDIHDLLISIGRHIGMAVEKTHLDAESQRLALMQERNMIAHELHDSLAQTLASLRIQAKMLGETLQQGGQATALDELGRITKALDVIAESAEEEVSRIAKRIGPDRGEFGVFELTVKGTLSVRSLKDQPIVLNITKRLTGELLSADDKPDAVKLATGLMALNPQQRLRWTIPLKARESKTVTYTYKVLVRS